MEKFAVIAVVAGLSVLGGGLLALMPKLLLAIAHRLMAQPGRLWIAVLPRLVLGSALIWAAGASSYPAVIIAMGGLALFAALVIVVVGTTGIRAMLTYIMRLPGIFIRLSGLVFCGFGLWLLQTI